MNRYSFTRALFFIALGVVLDLVVGIGANLRAPQRLTIVTRPPSVPSLFFELPPRKGGWLIRCLEVDGTHGVIQPVYDGECEKRYAGTKENFEKELEKK